MPTTLTVDPAVRDRLKKFGTHGMTYNEILGRLMDIAEKDAFFAEIRRRTESTDPSTWVKLDDLDEGFEPKDRADGARRASKTAPARKASGAGRASRARG